MASSDAFNRLRSSLNWDSGIALLSERGFTREAKEDGVCFVGRVLTKFGSVRVRLALDERGIRPPAIQLIERPDWLPRFSGHVGSDGTLCYIDEKLAHVTRADSAAVIVDSLSFATDAVERLVDLGGQVDEEFSILWSQGELCVLQPSATDQDWYWCVGGDEENPFYCILQRDGRDEVEAIAPIRSYSLIPAPVKIELSRMPIAAGPNWPVLGLKSFLDWVTFLDADAGRKAEKGLADIASASVRNGRLPLSVAFLVEHGDIRFGFFASLKNGSLWLPNGPQLRRLDTDVVINHWIRSQTGLTLRFRARSIDAKSILQRAMGPTSPNFARRKVTIVGVGSVGSYLADALIRSGAGSEGGTLRLIDFDTVSVENLARSNFTLADVGQHKVVALRNRLLKAWPKIAISTVTTRAEKISDLLDGDYIFDATGDVAFSNWLSEERNRITGPPLVTIWIVGSGQAVQSYLQHMDTQGCLACLNTENPTSPWSAVPDTSVGQFLTGPCGESFMPYSVCAPYVAAGLAASHALQHLAGSNTSLLRTINLSGTESRIVRDDAPPRCSRCPRQ